MKGASSSFASGERSAQYVRTASRVVMRSSPWARIYPAIHCVWSCQQERDCPIRVMPAVLATRLTLS
jgi:hypothetical protein